MIALIMKDHNENDNEKADIQSIRPTGQRVKEFVFSLALAESSFAYVPNRTCSAGVFRNAT